LGSDRRGCVLSVFAGGVLPFAIDGDGAYLGEGNETDGYIECDLALGRDSRPSRKRTRSVRTRAAVTFSCLPAYVLMMQGEV
jgi:hypothetical protein